MSAIEITPIYAASLALLFTALSMRVISYRIAHRVSLGDAGNKGLLKRMRAQANCAEYAPFGLLLLLLLELQGVEALWLHLLGVTLTLGRLAHAIGFSLSPPIFALRRIGMVLTFTQLVLSAGLLLF
jgi:uncharacterized membrane protein YecN with MAPEG domain